MSLMYKEAKEIPTVTQRQLDNYKKTMPDIIQRIKKFAPKFIVTVGRGSSDHAAAFAKYVFETELGLVTSSSAPSINTIYHSELQLSGALVIAFSQSGQSSDICEVLSQAKAAGALTIACVNQVDSPLADMAEITVPLLAETESAVAATKSYVATLVAIISLVAYWKNDQELIGALEQLPKYFVEAQHMDWRLLSKDMALRNSGIVLGRGYTFPIALEAALKLKETCKIHAEAFSSAEVLHGPFALMKQNFPLLVFVPTDAAAKGLESLLDRLKQIATKPYLAVAADHITEALEKKSHAILSLPKSLHKLCDPIVAVQAFYLMVEACAKLKNINPDAPDHLSKVTDTL